MAANSKGLTEKDLAELKSRLEQESLQNVLADTDQELKLLENTTLHIAVTGNTGAGKSSFVNAFRNISDHKLGAAKTDVEQTTMKPEKYPNDIFPEITLWDLPGIGTREFKANKYLESVNFSRYDFFIIVSAIRFTVNDTMLALEIKKMNKRFYFVRTKVDQDMDNERRKPNFSETQTLEKIRNDCISNLRKDGIVSPKVFLISRWHLTMYDFPKLHKTLADDLNVLKRPLLIMAMPAFSREHLQEKKAEMEKLIWKKALKSCGVGAIFVPGLSVAYDVHLLVSSMKEICRAFGLDEASLCNLAERIRKPVDVLKSAVKKTPMASQIDSKFVRSLATKFLAVGSAMVVEELARCIPVLGSLVGGATSFATTRYVLKSFLEDAMEDAQSVLAKATE
ncbi:PREDICTED: interferon-inducible GTPase 5-like [Gekko japonicus]|uniref:Interferon-inducible GTPase 5-like n=1 Tax=Gekko japonicus TaxID=146911 RepID=A0ABM1KBN7_GEKJA|nr:PREDICTED: interferon-inducible GTPase 5-like [Gekko japonicus]